MPFLLYEGVAVDLPSNLTGVQFEFTAGSLTIHCRNFTGDVVLSKRNHSIDKVADPIKKRNINSSASDDDEDEASVKRQRPNFLAEAEQSVLLSHLKRHCQVFKDQDKQIDVEPEAEDEAKKMIKKATDKTESKSSKKKRNTKKMKQEMNNLCSPEPKSSSSRKATPKSNKNRSKTLQHSPAESIEKLMRRPASLHSPAIVEWEAVEASGAVPLERWGHTATKISDERVVIYGGTDDDERTLGDLHIFDLKTHRWTTPLNCETITRTWHDAVYLASKNLVLVFGGERNAAVEGELDILSDIMVLDTECFLWYPPAIQGSPPSSRSGHTCTVVGNEVVVFGGSSGRNRQSSVHILDTDDWNWKTVKVENKPPSARTYHSAVAIGDDRIVYFGGNDSSASFNAVYVLQKIDKKPNEMWTWVSPCITGEPPQGRTGHTATLLHDGKILVFGGWDPQRDDASALTSVFNDAFLLNTKTWEWQPATFSDQDNADTALRGRVGHGAVLGCNGKVYLFGGQNEAEQRLKTICTLKATDTMQNELKS